MKTKRLVKPCPCAACGEPMAVGEPFAWHKGTVKRPCFALGPGSGRLVEVERFRPRHVHDCYSAKIKAELDRAAMDRIGRACTMAAQYGESPEWIADYRARLLQEAGLTEAAAE